MPQDTASTAEHNTAALPDTPDTDDWIILHVDCDCFYAACERLRNPDLENEPLIIGMGYDETNTSGAVATASYEAREHGVESAMPISEALEKLPRRIDADTDDPAAPNPSNTAYYRPVDMDYYEEIGTTIHDILSEHADTFEPVSIDEAYLDVTTQTTWGAVHDYAESLKTTIRNEVGIPVSIGAAPTKSAAKVASDHDKPDGLVVVQPGEVREFFAPLDVEEIHGIGPVTANTLQEMGIETADDLATTDPKRLVNEFGTRGRDAHQRARGHDPRPVTPPDDPKSISNESSLGDPVTDWDRKHDVLTTLVEKVTARATDQNALYQTIGVKAVTPPFDVNTRVHTLPGPVSDRELVQSLATGLFEEFADTPVRKIGVKLSNLSLSENKQPSLTEWNSESGNNSTTDAAPGEYSAEQAQETATRRRSSGQQKLTDFTQNP